MSACMNSAPGLFRSYVSLAVSSASTPFTTRMPASIRPRVSPPTPQNISMQTILLLAFFCRGIHCINTAPLILCFVYTVLHNETEKINQGKNYAKYKQLNNAVLKIKKQWDRRHHGQYQSFY